MTRPSSGDPLDKFRFKVAFAVGTTTVFESDGVTPKLGPDNLPTKQQNFTAGFHDFQMPKRTTNKGVYREGNNPTVNQIFAGLTTMEDIVLSKGIYASPLASGTPSGKTITDFYSWAQAVHTSSSTDSAFNLTGTDVKNSSSKDYKKDLYIVMFNRSGQPARAWAIYNAFPVHFVPGSDLNASEDGDKSMEALTLAYEDFEEVDLSKVGG